MTPEGFDNCIRDMQNGTLPTNQEVVCPACGGMAHLHAGTLTARTSQPTDELWVQGWCEDCGLEEKIDGVPAWTGWELLAVSDAQRFTPRENAERIKRVAAKGRYLQALRLYRTIYGVDLQEARRGLERMLQEG